MATLDYERIRIKPRVRQEVLERDGNKCKKCGTSENLTIDHIIPLSEGGQNIKQNYQTLCADCNILKSNKYKLPFIKHLRKIWFIHDYIQVLKVQLKGMYQAYTNQQVTILKTEFEKKVSDLQSANDQRVKKIVSEVTEIIKKQTEIIKKFEARVEQDEKIIGLLVDYLEVEYVAPKAKDPYFRKIIIKTNEQPRPEEVRREIVEQKEGCNLDKF